MRELDGYGRRSEVVAAGGGRRYVVKSAAFWEGEPWESRLYVIVRVRQAAVWWRRVRRYSSVVVRDPSS